VWSNERSAQPRAHKQHSTEYLRLPPARPFGNGNDLVAIRSLDRHRYGRSDRPCSTVEESLYAILAESRELVALMAGKELVAYKLL
jgi:hypothetical protein